MTVTEFESFENVLFTNLKEGNKNALKIIDENEKLIEFYLNGDNQTIRKFVTDFNNLLLDKNVKYDNYILFENILNHRLFTKVLDQFRESDILIRACADVKKCYIYFNNPNSYDEKFNKKLIEWLLTMNINYGVQDEKGRTALMYAVKYKDEYFAVKKMMHGKHINLLDKNGNSALFYASEAYFTLEEFLKYKNLFDVNHLNNKNENLFLFATRTKKINCFESLKVLKKYSNYDVNIMNDEGMTAAMYMISRGEYKLLEYLLENYNIDVNHVNKFGNSLLSVLIKSYYEFYCKTIEKEEGFGVEIRDYKRYALCFKILNKNKKSCDFKKPIDEENNTVFDVLSKMNDKVISKYLLKKGNVDFIVESTTNQSQKYPQIDGSKPIIKKNSKILDNALEDVIPSSRSIGEKVNFGLGKILSYANYTGSNN